MSLLLLFGGVTVQVLPPVSDVSAGTWKTQAGSTANLWATLDEAAADDADYIISQLTPSTSKVTLALSSTGADPGVGTGHVVKYRYQKNLSGNASMALTVRLMQTNSTIASWTHNNISTGWVTASQTLSTAQADSISDYTALRIQFDATQT